MPSSRTDRPAFLEIKNWKKLQHYKDDRPAWIKLYGALLDDAAFLALSDAAQLQLIKLWLLASRMGHPLPHDARLLGGKIGCRGKLQLDALLASGFLKIVYENSREVVDDSSGTKTENRQQQRTERETTVVVSEPPKSLGGGEIVGVIIGQPADYALQVTIAANNAVTQKWGEQIHPYLHGNSYELGMALQEAGVPLDVAKDSIASQVTKSGRALPPASINWFRPGVLTFHAEQQQKVIQAANPAEPVDSFGLHKWAKEHA